MNENCPVCGHKMGTDYVWTGEEEVPMWACFECGWPPNYPVSVEEWREHYMKEQSP